MEDLSGDIVSILKYLLPGFLTAWIFYGLTSYPKPSQFERVIQALIFTLIIEPLSFMVMKVSVWIGKYHSFGQWNEQSEVMSSIACAVVMGFVFSFFANTDKFHGMVRKLGISKETSYPSEWFGVFSKKVTYVVLHLVDDRRIYGWPIEWPSESSKGHFSLTQASWLTQDKQIDLINVEAILIPASDVRYVEFVRLSEDKIDEQKVV